MKLEKPKLHVRNKHQGRYDFHVLGECLPDLIPFVKLNNHNDLSIDFANPAAVKTFNKALLKFYYGIEQWDIPSDYLCPPVPGRADYIHNIADLLGSIHSGHIPTGNKIKCLDVGVGANCIYSIIGYSEYGWSFVGADIDASAVESAAHIVSRNPQLRGNIDIRLQDNPLNTLQGIIQKQEKFDLTLCNPPFHGSSDEARAGSLRKTSNLTGKTSQKLTLNFGGKSNELWCEGGELQFVENLILQSRLFAKDCLWFSSLLAKQIHLKPIYSTLKKAEAKQVVTIPMGQGNKVSRIVAWTFLDTAHQRQWVNSRW